MLDKIRGLFLRKSDDGDTSQLDLEQIFEDLQRLITHNRLKLVENESLISRVETASATEEDSVRNADNDFLKRCYLQRVRVLRKRVKHLNRCSTIYNDNISMQTQISDRLEDMRVSGLKTISTDILEEIALDNDEMYSKHRELVNSVNDMISTPELPDNFDDDPELKALAKECGL